MSNHDEDLRALLRQAADRAKSDAGAEMRLLKSARRRRRMTAAAVAMTMLVLVGGLAGAATLLGDRDGITPAPGRENIAACEQPMYDVAVFIEDAATESEIQALRQDLDEDSEVEALTFMSKKAAFEEFKEHYADQPEFWENLPEDALPMSFRVSLVDGADSDAAARRFKILDHVEAVRTREDLSKEQGARGAAAGCPSNTFARYFFEAGSRDASASGVLEVNSEEGTLCYEATTENIQASHLLRNTGVVAGGRRFERMIVVTFFDSGDSEQGAELPSGAPICFQGEQLGELAGDLQVLIDHPEDFAVDFHRGPDDEPGLVAELVPRTEDEVHEVESFAAAIFKDDELEEAIPAGFSLTRIVRNGPDETNHDYATVGVQMQGPTDYARVIFFVHPTEGGTAEMGLRRSEALTLNWKTQRDGSDAVVKPFAVSNALPGSTCGTEPHLVTCHVSLGRVVVLTQSAEEGPGTRVVTAQELAAAETLIRSFGSYLERIYPEHNEMADCPVTTPSDPAFVPPEPYPPRPPDLYQKEWYGSERLWTWIAPEGGVWQDLPDEDGDGRFTEKTFWWSDAMGNRLAPITVRGRRLDGRGSFKTRGPGGGGFREDIGSFMMVGVEIPAGCWKLTGAYRGAELSFVVLVKDQR